jgi:hypothetical protein
MTCGTEIKSYSEPHAVKTLKQYKLQAFGKPGIRFRLKVKIRISENDSNNE